MSAGRVTPNAKIPEMHNLSGFMQTYPQKTADVLRPTKINKQRRANV